MKETDKINKIHDKLFSKTFGNPDNTKAFLAIALPEPLLGTIDLSQLEIDNTHYVSDKFKDSFSDMVVRTKINTASDDETAQEADADIYILFEHKSYRDMAILIQLLRYMILMWEKDLEEEKPLRVIVPVVFYHGKDKWNIPRSFNEQFNVNDEIKTFLLNYRYILFDTGDWNFRDERNADLKDNVFLLTALALMKSAFNEDFDTIVETFKFWHEKGFTGDLEKVLFFLTYISETKDISQEKLKKVLEDSHIDGGDIMLTLADRLRKEGEERGEKRGEKRGRKIGIEETRLETAKRMMNDGVSIKNIAKYTGLSEKEIESLSETVH